MNFNEENLREIYEEFGVNSEQELLKKLDEESQTLPCFICKKEYEIDVLNFSSGEPICKNCIGE